MKKTLSLTAMLVAITIPLLAGVLPYSLPDDFTIDYLIMENYDLDVVGDSILISGSGRKVQKRDSIIASFQIPELEEIDSWIVAYADTCENVSYTQTCKYISDVLGEGVSEKNTRFLIERYSSEPTEEKLFSMLLSGEMGEYLGKAIPALAIKQAMIEAENAGTSDEDIRLNMWKGDGITVYTT